MATVQYVALGAYCLLCKALVACILLYCAPAVAFDAHGMLRSISGVVLVHRVWCRFGLCLLFGHLHVVLLLLAEAHGREQPLLGPVSAIMLTAGLAIACFELDTHPGLHCAGLVVYLVHAGAYATLLTLADGRFLASAAFLNAATAAFLAYYAFNAAVRGRAWDSAQTGLELVWFVALYVFFARCCMRLANLGEGG